VASVMWMEKKEAAEKIGGLLYCKLKEIYFTVMFIVDL
jgi:hypothetical protein